MLRLSDADRLTFAASAVQAGARPELVEAVRSTYADFERERAARSPRCDRSGRCCRFEEHGHRLFVTTVEVAAFRAGLAATPVASVNSWDGTGCPYQVDGLCNAHDARPFGCRVYFCDPAATEWQHEQYERFHAALRELHDRFGVPYLYAEWRDALAAIGLPEADRPADGSAERPSLKVRLRAWAEPATSC